MFIHALEVIELWRPFSLGHPAVPGFSQGSRTAGRSHTRSLTGIWVYIVVGDSVSSRLLFLAWGLNLQDRQWGGAMGVR